jgi:hypothetical protein
MQHLLMDLDELEQLVEEVSAQIGKCGWPLSSNQCLDWLDASAA